MTIVEGTKIRLSAVFMTAAGVVDDPTTIVLKMRLTPFTYVYTYGEVNYDILEDGELPTTAAGPPDIVRDSAGNYHLDIVMDTPGDWMYYWVGTGDVVAVGRSANPIKVEALPF